MLSQELYLQALNSTRDGLIITEAKGRDNPIIYANPAFLALTGFTLTEVLGQDCRFLQGTNIDQAELALIRLAIQKGESVLVTLRNYKKDGSIFWNELSISPIKDALGTVTHFIGIQKDVTERVELKKKLEAANARLQQLNEQLKQENKIDALTGLYNRKVIAQEVSILWDNAIRANEYFSVLFIDIDHFKAINDTYGHDAGDIGLKHIAYLLQKSINRRSDILLRNGGEEFLIFLFSTKEEEALALAQQINTRIAETPVKIKEPNIIINMTVSIGLVSAIASLDKSLDELINAADKAMYQAKMHGRNTTFLAKC
ncbi:MAG: diguanylate cyclase [Methylococcaceae bacterium]|nr:diguanylate cyclase [Methylococcaceae bacterium]